MTIELTGVSLGDEGCARMAWDAVVVGAGPNGLTAAITLARAGLSVVVYEAMAAPGGGARTEELTLPGFRHDPYSAVHPLGVGSPAFADMPLARYGLRWIHPDIPLAQPFDDGSAVVASRDVAQTLDSLGVDSAAYQRLIGPFLGRWSELAPQLLRPPALRAPRSPMLLGRFAMPALLPMTVVSRMFRRQQTRALLAGLAAHVLAPLGSPVTTGVAMMFALAAHDVGWPFPEGGAQSLADALAAYLRSMGGELVFGEHISDIAQLPPARAYLFDVAPTALAAIAGDRLPRRSRRALSGRSYGPAVFKVDYALSEPVPWKNSDCRRAGTVHLGESVAEIGASLRAANSGQPPVNPFLITAQPTLFDPTRAPAGRHTFWAYAHVPNGWRGDALDVVERQIERYAPGFRDVVLARSVIDPAGLEARNPNNVGGNITVGSCEGLRGMVRPSVTQLRAPYATGNPEIYLCSSATTPGPGVHGMCGLLAAELALRRRF